MTGRFIIPASLPMPGAASRFILNTVNYNLLWLKDYRYRVLVVVVSGCLNGFWVCLWILWVARVNRQHDRQSICYGSANRRKRSNSLAGTAAVRRILPARKKILVHRKCGRSPVRLNTNCGNVYKGDWNTAGRAVPLRIEAALAMRQKICPTPSHSNHHRPLQSAFFCQF
jgi:hypothetical protein